MLKKIKILEPLNPNKSTAIINGEASGIVNWNDIRYPSFYRAYKELTTNYWLPDEVDMKSDAKQYNHLPEEEKYAFDSIIGLLATLDSPQTRFIYNIAEYVSDASVHAITAIIAQQEAIHNESYSYVLASITNLQEQNRVFEEARTHPTIIKRNAPIMESYDDFMNNKTPENMVKALVQSSILEGINFYSGFAYFYNLVRQNKMTGTGKIISFINRDELAHSKFISELIRAIVGENPELQTDELNDYVYASFRHAVELEQAWSSEVLQGIEGIDVEEMLDYVKYRANKMLGMLGLQPMYQGHTENSMTWIKAYADNFTETKTDFFEMRNSSYKKTNLDNGFDDL
ncbi:ribonucleotide reductase of class Ia (aerobic) beta subunit [Listeria phage LMTA-57]|uniref:ribonucleoside-diphosphate reductase n=3 Tax=Pecentumvirus TaxID=1857844 RepID=A0A060AC74_9CAUD|nr:ribonucleoside diphosphate reductase small subunit [Listeria phage LMSP-25]YP_009616250.1 ribonucleoside diphosphate reductase small subunit [Listeria phage LMTA-34]YP_009793395.1 ribonucleotide reductase of class Ia (aerobic) beta subunit [Listeria phage LMTA-57]AIA64490.1 ribonucleotide reductase of class Ia (aerobic),beta subunit [Listeria phage LMSP-25]AID17048.1 ribonucleotide reductase of class Ia (aerobic) beta subunit [Listeria phage LMTA-34]AID17546.1 ribonucleotide reductase of cl